MDLDAQDSMALLLVSRDKKKQVIKLPVQANGQFAQNGLFFYDSVQVVYRFNHTSKIRNGQISVYSSLLPALTPAHADDLAMGVLRHLPDEHFPVFFRHPVLWFDADLFLNLAFEYFYFPGHGRKCCHF